jgi:hemerythrin-like metal-binding protein
MTLLHRAALPGDHNKSLMVISDEHAHLVRLLNTLSYCIERKPLDRDAIAVALDDILEETREHFLHEEDLMIETGCPGYIDHQKDHEHILKLIQGLIEQNNARTADITAEARQLIEQSMSVHFEKFDRNLIIVVSEEF